MPIKRPDIYVHNNPHKAIVDSNQVRGGIREYVNNLSDLYLLSENIDQLKEHSTIIYVISEDSYYELVSLENVNNSNGWKLFMNSSLPVLCADNGLSVVNKNVELGGNLNKYTEILTSNNKLTLSSNNYKSNYIISLSSDYSKSGVYMNSCDSGSTGSQWYFNYDCNGLDINYIINSANNSSISVNENGIKLSTKGSNVIKEIQLNNESLNYLGNYSGTYTNRSLVDKEYVDVEISKSSNCINVCNIGIDYYEAKINDDFIGVSGSTCIYLYPTPFKGLRVSVVDICGNALMDPIKVDGNGNNINDGTISTINTNYGSVTYVFNGMFWSPTGFVN